MGRAYAVGGRFVPAAALGDVVEAGGDGGRKRLFGFQFFFVVDVVGDAVADGRVEVAVGVFLQQPPYAPGGREGDGALLFGAIKEEGDDGVAADVAGDVLFGIVGAHLLLVDILFEDVAEHVGVDFVVVAQGAVVEMPLVGVEEGKDLFEGLVGNVDVGMVALEVMDVEEAAVEVGDAAKEGG